MKKRRFAVQWVCVALLLAAFTAASAAAGDAGFYDIGSAPDVEILPVTASGEEAVGVSRNVDGADGEELFFPDSCALRITLTDTAPQKLYFLTVSSGEDFFYADQQVGGGAVSFLVSFSLPEQPAEMTVDIASNAEGFARRSIPVSYTPFAEAGEDVSGTAPQESSGEPPQETPGGPSQETSGEPPQEASGAADPVPAVSVAACPRDSACPAAAYADLDPGAWYHDGVHWALEKGVMKGVSAERNEFAPDMPTDRAAIVTMLYRMEGEPESAGSLTFLDVPAGMWYTEPIRWAAENGIVTGYSDERFGVGDVLTREQLVTILERYARFKGADASAGEYPELSDYSDASDVSEWAAKAMRWAVAAGVVSGGTDGQLSPKLGATRAQVATMLMRFAALSL